MGLDLRYWNRLREQARSKHTTLGEHLRTTVREVGVPALTAVAASLLIFLIAMGSNNSVLVFAALVELFALGAMFVAAGLRYQDFQGSINDPLNELLSNLETAHSDVRQVRTNPYGATEIHRIAAAVAELTRTAAEEREQRAANELAAASQSSMLQRVLRAQRAVSGSIDLDEILRLAAHESMELAGYQQVTVWMLDEATGKLVAAHHNLPNTPESIAVGDGDVGRAARVAQLVTMKGESDVAGIAMPLVMGLETLGVIELRQPAKDFAWSEEHLEALEALASHTSAAITMARLHEEVERRSETDGLTKLLNRRRLDSDLKSEAARSIRYGHALSLVMVDLDHFKDINDTYGHQIGDDVLKLAATLLSREVRGSDSVYRFGGEEFSILLRDTKADAAAGMAERLRGRLQAAFSEAKLVDREITASLGVAAVSEKISSAEALVEAADAALYTAKNRGRNRVTVSPLV